MLLDRLWTRVRTLGVRIRCRFADKGFCAIPVLRWLTELHLPALIAAPIRGKQGGTRALCQGRASYRTTHTFRSADQGEVTVPVTVGRTYQRQWAGGRRGAWLVYICLGVDDPPPRMRKRYRRRFGIESSYRLMEQVRGRTTSPKVALRFVLMGLALLIGNVWIWLHWQFLRVHGRGRRRVAREHFRLDRMARFLTRAIERTTVWSRLLIHQLHEICDLLRLQNACPKQGLQHGVVHIRSSIEFVDATAGQTPLYVYKSKYTAPITAHKATTSLRSGGLLAR